MIVTIALIENNILATNTIRNGLTFRLIEKGYDVWILTTGTAKELKEARKTGLNIIDVGAGTEGALESFSYLKRLYRALKSIKPAIILTFTVRPNIWGNLAARLVNKPVISSITGVGSLFSSTTLSFRIARFLYRIALKKTRIVFFQNNDDKDLFLRKKMVKSSQVKTIAGSGVDTGFFMPQESTTPRMFSFLFIGRLIKDKGILDFIQAARNLKDKGAQADCVVVGPFWSQNFKANAISHEELQRWCGDGIIQYEGDTSDVRPFIANADCIVLPSYREGLSNVLLEAGSMEKPTIAYNVTGCKEVIVDEITGYLCEPRNIDDLTAKMMQMLGKSVEDRQDMGKAARNRIQMLFEKNLVIDNYLKAIRSLTS